MKLTIKKLDIKRDERGWLAEVVRPEDVGDSSFGQILVTTAGPGHIKGNHYHKRKTEWYCVLQGKALLTIINNKTRERKEISMGDDNMVLVKIPPHHFHAIKNIGKNEMFLLVYVSEPFNPSDPDIYYDKQMV